MLRTLPRRQSADAPPASAVLALFLSLFAAQAGLTATSPVLASIGADFGISTSSAGQLRTVAGLAAVATALALGPVSGRLGLRALLAAGLGLLCGASLLSALAPSLVVLGLAQGTTGASVAVLMVAGTTAAGRWGGPGGRARLLSYALVGQACSWILGMPLVGALGGESWRYALAVPLAAALAALLAVRRAPAGGRSRLGGGIRDALADRRVRAWALGEALAFSAWAGTLVYAGALLVETYDASLRATGIALAAGGAAYLPGNALARRMVDRHARGLLVGTGLTAAAAVAAFGGLRAGLVESAALFALLGFLGGARTLAGSSYGLAAAGGREAGAMSIRAAALYAGYLAGGALGGGALALGGYPALGSVLALLFLGGVSPHLLALLRLRRDRRVRGRGCAGLLASGTG